MKKESRKRDPFKFHEKFSFPMEVKLDMQPV